MAELLTRHRRQDWGGLQGGSGVASRIADDFTVLPPEARWDRSIRCTLQNGDIAPWSNQGSSSSVSVAQVQAATHQDSTRRDRWISMWLRYEQVAAYSSLDFHFSHEVHTTGSALSAAWGENVTTSQRQLRRTPSGYNHVWPNAARSSLDIGIWHWYSYGFGWATGSTGFAELQIDSSLVYSETNIVTSADGAAWYPKLGWYRYSSVSGTDVCYIAGWALHDSRPTYPGGGGAGGGGGNVSTPAVAINSPAASSILIGTLPYDVDVTDSPSGATLYTGLGSSGIYDTISPASGSSNHTGSLDLTGIPTAGRADAFYASLLNAQGTQLAQTEVPVTVYPPTSASPSGDMAAAISATSSVSADLREPANSRAVIPANKVVYRMVNRVVTYSIPTPYHIDTDAELEWDSGDLAFYQKGV